MFVDAVIAIALTLLALDLPVPTGDTTDALASTSFALIVREVRPERLYRPDVEPPEFARSLVRSICLAAVFGVSVPPRS
jgi:hypothetical protein